MKTIQEIAQWVIDNRYPKNENDKVSDFEMYQTLIESMNQALSMSGVNESDIDLIFTLKSESEASEQLPLHRIMAYNSRQIDRREGAKLLLKLMNHSRYEHMNWKDDESRNKQGK